MNRSSTPPEFRPTFEPPGQEPSEATAPMAERIPDVPDLPEAHDLPGAVPGAADGSPFDAPFDPSSAPSFDSPFDTASFGDAAAGPPPMLSDLLDGPDAPEDARGEAPAGTTDRSFQQPRTRPGARPRPERSTFSPEDLPPEPIGRRRPDVMRPVHAREDDSRPGLVSSGAESSDVVKTFDSGELELRPEPLRPNPASPRRALIRRSTRARRPPSRRPPPPPPRSAARPPPSRPAPARPTPAFLPLSPEGLAMMITEQRRRLHVLDGFARGLEIVAGVLGTLSLAVLIASLVSILVGTDVSVLNASSALVGSGAAMALTLLMVVAAVALRQVAHLSAQLAALLEALSQRR